MRLKAYQRESATEETILFSLQTAGRACELWLCRGFGAVCFEHSTSVVIPCVPAQCSHTALPLQMRFIRAPSEQQWQRQTPHGNADLIPFFSFFSFCCRHTREVQSTFLFQSQPSRSFQERMDGSAGDLHGVSVDLKWEFLSQSCDWNTAYL